MRIGVVAPRSSFISHLGPDIVDHLKLGLACSPSDEPAEIVTRASSYNATAAEVGDRLSQLILERVDAVVLPLNAGLVPTISEVAASAELPVVALTMGEDVCVGDAAPPWVFVNSLSQWRSAWLLGRHAAFSGHRVATAAAEHQGGYGMGFAVGLGAEAAGGQVEAVAVTRGGDTADDMASALRNLQLDTIDVIIANYWGDESRDFARAVGDLDLPQLSLFGFAPAAYLPGHQMPAPVIGSYETFGTWAPSDASQSFLEASYAATGRATSAYALLAYEAGMLLAEAGARCQKLVDASLADSLRTIRVAGPRGTIGFDEQNQEVVAPQHRLSIESGSGQTTVTAIEQVETPELLIEHVSVARRNLQKQGWLNPYLIA